MQSIKQVYTNRTPRKPPQPSSLFLNRSNHMKSEPKTRKNATGLADTVVPAVGLFYPIHYRFGMKLERRMCLTRLSRQQAAVIWVIHSEADEHGWVRRRTIELALHSWFECCNSRVSRLIKELACAPLHLIVQRGSPASKREKVIALTEAGRNFFSGMQQAGEAFFSEYFSHMSHEELLWGHRFMSKAFATQRPRGESPIHLPLPLP